MKLKVKVAIVLDAEEASMSLHMMEGYASMRKGKGGDMPNEEEDFLNAYREMRGKASRVLEASPVSD